VGHPPVAIVYDGDGNRVSETVAGVTTKYLVDAQNPTGYAQVVDEIQNGSVAKSYSYGLERISQRPTTNGQGPSFYGYDGHGSVRFLTDSTGAVTDTYDYDAFGNLINSTGSTANNYLFAGEQYDPALDLYYNRARYLNTTIGRFWSTDTDEGEDESPLSLHKYLFVEADPTDNRDESGNEIDEVVGSLAVAATIDSLPTLQLNATIGSSASYPDIHEQIAQTALSYVGSRHWFQSPIPSAHTVVTWDETCNLFVYDVLKEVGANPPKLFRPGTVRASLYQLAYNRLYETPPVSHEWADKGFYIPYWEVVPGGSADAKPGDVIAEQHANGGGHSGIVVGNRQTASASAVGLNFGKIVKNDWGFRPDTYNGTGKARDAVVRRFIGISDLIGNGGQ